MFRSPICQQVLNICQPQPSSNLINLVIDLINLAFFTDFAGYHDRCNYFRFRYWLFLLLWSCNPYNLPLDPTLHVQYWSIQPHQSMHLLFINIHLFFLFLFTLFIILIPWRLSIIMVNSLFLNSCYLSFLLFLLLISNLNSLLRIFVFTTTFASGFYTISHPDN